MDLTAGVDYDVVVLTRQQTEQLLEGRRIVRARPIELIGSGENLEARLVLQYQLAKELAIEPMQVVDRIDQAVLLADAAEQRHLAQARLEVDDDGRSLTQARDRDAAVDGDGRRPRSAFRAEEHESSRGGLGALRRVATRRGFADRPLESVVWRRPQEKLVGAGPHRLEDELWIGSSGYHEDAGIRRGRSYPLDRRHRA